MGTGSSFPRTARPVVSIGGARDGIGDEFRDTEGMVAAVSREIRL
ncbi:hypothetical protein GPROT1_03294 [Gammaproteobacteria bacterium]|jgi:hypothetical protein|nr:hypothetical protein GPROT1_03294 [Gammaproteobacteria bacterium]